MTLNAFDWHEIEVKDCGGGASDTVLRQNPSLEGCSFMSW
jgi:hypothetical protein